MRKNIEATILSSFLDADYYDGEAEKVFELDEDVFSCEAFKYFARNIGKHVKANMPMSLLYEKLDETMAGTAYELDYLFMVGRMHLSMEVVRKYYDDLVMTHRKALVRGML